MEYGPDPRRERRRRLAKVGLAALVVALWVLALRAILPSLAEAFVHRNLRDVSGYQARVGDADRGRSGGSTFDKAMETGRG